jgi:hypothetical protein
MKRSMRSTRRASRIYPTASMGPLPVRRSGREGLTGVLTEQADAWYYKRNLGNGTFSSIEPVAPKPSLQR